MKETVNLSSAEEKLKTQPQISCLTAGASMKPLFKTHRDIAIINRVDEHNLRENDVVLYRYKAGDKLILHRIIKILPNDTYIIRGDNTYTREYVKRDMIIGVLESLYRKGKYINCESSNGYRIYIVYIRLSYPIRFVLYKTRRMLGKFKRKFIDKKSTC